MKWIIALSLFWVYGYASTLDYITEKEQERMYCQMVEDGYWGEYNTNIDCGGDDEPAI